MLVFSSGCEAKSLSPPGTCGLLPTSANFLKNCYLLLSKIKSFLFFKVFPDSPQEDSALQPSPRLLRPGSLITACVGCGWAVDWSFYTRLFHVLGLPRIWKGLVEGASPVSIPRGPGRSWEVSYDLVLEGSEHHFCGFCCPENHQGRPTSQVREAASPSPYKEARSYKEGRN